MVGFCCKVFFLKNEDEGNGVKSSVRGSSPSIHTIVDFSFVSFLFSGYMAHPDANNNRKIDPKDHI